MIIETKEGLLAPTYFVLIDNATTATTTCISYFCIICH